MTTFELPEITAETLAQQIYASTGFRSPGLHLSDIIDDIESILYPKEYERKKSINNSWFACVGFIWEKVLSLAFRYILGKRPQEIVRDSIACSLDGINDDLELVDEYKATWRSTKTKPWDVWRWMIQIKAYCYVAGYNIARFHVLYVMGDYKFSGPKCLPFMIEFTEEELMSNWMMLVEHAKTMPKKEV